MWVVQKSRIVAHLALGIPENLLDVFADEGTRVIASRLGGVNEAGHTAITCWSRSCAACSSELDLLALRRRQPDLGRGPPSCIGHCLASSPIGDIRRGRQSNFAIDQYQLSISIDRILLRETIISTDGCRLRAIEPTRAAGTTIYWGLSEVMIETAMSLAANAVFGLDRATVSLARGTRRHTMTTPFYVSVSSLS